MFSFLKNFLRKPADEPAEISEPSVATAPEPAPEPQAYGNGFVPVARPVAPRAAAPAAPGAARGIEISLQSIINSLPLELQPRLLQRDVGAATIVVPQELVLSQLSRGSVTLTFGQLRQAAPFAFSPEPDRDKTPVFLPLSEILSKLNPSMMTCRRTQRQVEVPEDIVSPFDPASQSLAFQAPEPHPAPVQQRPVPRQTIPAAPAAPFAPAAPVSPLSGRGAIHSAPTPPPPAAAPIHIPNIFSARAVPAAPEPPKSNSNLSYTVQPTAAKPGQTGASEPLPIGLTSLAEAWPENIRQEIVQLNLVDAKVGLPVDVVEQGLKQGRLAFSWRIVRSWVKNVAVPPVSAQDGVIVELPLKVVAPLFLRRKKESSKEQQKVNINTEIPNLFFGFPQADSGAGPAAGPAASAAAPVAKSVDTNYYVWDDNNDTAFVNQEEVKRTAPAPSAGTRFINRCATPNEVVSRAAALEGVAGALIALPDGLMVASKLSPDLNGDTLAAFLPQIFSKVTQCTKELRMGELNNLNFTVGNVPWKIFRVNAIFFAAFGRAGEAMPSAQLAALAAELDHRKQ
jgi:predicted regulator of Ras-like GTPase activity (Roadblock/LC7/MglB family)